MVTVEGIATTHQCWGFAILIQGYPLDPYVPSLTPMSINKMHAFPGFPRLLSGKESICQAGDEHSIPG